MESAAYKPKEISEAACSGSIRDCIVGVECEVTGPVGYRAGDRHYNRDIGQWTRPTDKQSPYSNEGNEEPNTAQYRPAQLKVGRFRRLRVMLGELGIHLDRPRIDVLNSKGLIAP